MKNYYDENDDPIKDVAKKSVFGRIKSFEENDEYNFEKEMEKYEKSISNSQVENTNANYQTTIPNKETANLVIIIVFFTILISIFILLIYGGNTATDTTKELPIKTSLGSDTPDLNDELDQKMYYMLSYIKFTEVGNIDALYKYDTQTKGNWCNFTESDERFNGLANTFQINYNYIPEYSKNKLINGLIEENFKHVVDYPTGSVYAINKNNGYSLFVLISEKDIIYGAYYGEYQDLFGE